MFVWGGVLVLGAVVDHGHDDGGEKDPGELIPVEKGKAEEGWCEAGVELWEEQAGVGKEKQEEPGRWSAAGGWGCFLGALHGRRIDHFGEVMVRLGSG